MILPNSRLLQVFFAINCLLLVLSNGEIRITGRCGKPGLPPRARLHLISPERSRFDNNEEVFIRCPDDEFPHHKQSRICKNGKWTEKEARCGKSIDAQVIQLEVFNCDLNPQQIILDQAFNQSESEYDLPPNSFHSSRVDENITISTSESTCTQWRLHLNKEVQIAHLLIDIFTPTNASASIPTLDPTVSKFRKCSLQKTSHQNSNEYEIIGYYYFCDVNSDDDYKKDMNSATDEIIVRINTSVVQEVGLEGVFLGGIYLSGKSVKPDCGELEIKHPGVMIQKEAGTYQLRCNDSFYDYWKRRDFRYKFTCNYNGQWVGEWPTCVPIVSCSKDEIIKDKHESIEIEEIGNVFYVNSTDWYAINESWVRFSCHQLNDIMVGKDLRVCQKDGRWSNQQPYCTSTRISVLAISGILFCVLIVFSIIVFVLFRFYSRRVKKDLKQTRQELHDSTRKRLSAELYADVTGAELYDVPECDQRKSMYDTINYEVALPRYQIRPSKGDIHENEYLDMILKKD